MKEIQIDYDDSRMRSQINVANSRIIGTIISFLLMVILSVVVTFIARRQGTLLGSGLEIIFAWVLGLAFVTGAFSVVRNLMWRKRLEQYLPFPNGSPAMIVDAHGIRSGIGNVLWSQVAEFKATKSRRDAGHTLFLRPAGAEPMLFPLDGLSMLPGDLDAVVRAYTQDRIGIDLTSYDH